MYYVYVLRNHKGVLYKGFTQNLSKRLDYHNSKKVTEHYTSNRGPWDLVYCEEFKDEAEARSRERFFKSGKGREFLKNILNG